MNKYLESFKHIKIGDYSLLENKYIHEEELNIVEEGLNALDLIVKKNVDVSLIKKYDFVEDYNSTVWIAGRPKLVKEEFDFLKKVFQ